MKIEDLRIKDEMDFLMLSLQQKMKLKNLKKQYLT